MKVCQPNPDLIREGIMRFIVCLMLLAIVLTSTPAAAKELEEYITESTGLQEGGDLKQAVAVMEQAIAEFPDSPDAYAYFGLYRLMQSGEASDAGDFMGAGTLSQESVTMLDKAIELDPEHINAHLYRGILGVNMPEFMGMLDRGIEDLVFVVKAHEQAPDEVPADLAATAYRFLGMGYSKKKQKDEAKTAWEKVIELAPETPAAKEAEEGIAGLSPQPAQMPKGEFDGLSSDELRAKSDVEPGNADLLVALGKAYMDEERYGEAEKVLREAIGLDSLNAGGYKWLGIVIAYSMSGEELYDDRIHENTDWAIEHVMESMGYLDKAVELAPDDIEARSLNGIMAVTFPFFAGRLEQGITNLQMVLDSNAPDEMKAEATYWMGYGYQKKAMTFWINVVSEYPEEEAARLVFESMRPAISRLDLSKQRRPVVTVDFVLGFRDEVPPQTAVWVETENGKFVRTIYVSGFSGHVKEVQIVLPVWASTSKFADADAVTGASVNVGEHMYAWDLMDASGEKVDPGTYVVKVETHYWPSMSYQMVEAEVSIGEVEDRVVVEEGDFIPYLEVRYLP
jgi:tetratricopeptide (TPR) repeat protein